jgi:lipopolysaccharide/colanic/teichoic acid biosynthesis glycosyltransferase
VRHIMDPLLSIPNNQAGLPRGIEITLALVALAVVLPLLAVIAIAVVLTSSRPVLFRHRRVGRGGTCFTLIKFRTMRSDRSGAAVTAKTDPRITSFGRLLRKSKLDELPELWNVVRGDMSLVGPRPEAVEYVDLRNPAWQEVLSVRPGITDPMTLRLRNEEELLAASGVGHEEFYRRHLLPYKLSGYRTYIRERTWARDVAVLWLTLLAVVLPGRVPAPCPDDIMSSQQAVS